LKKNESLAVVCVPTNDFEYMYLLLVGTQATGEEIPHTKI